MNASRTLVLVDAETRKRLGTVLLDQPLPAGEIVRRFRRDEIVVEVEEDRPPFAGRGGVHDERGKKKPA